MSATVDPECKLQNALKYRIIIYSSNRTKNIL